MGLLDDLLDEAGVPAPALLASPPSPAPTPTVIHTEPSLLTVRYGAGAELARAVQVAFRVLGGRPPPVTNLEELRDAPEAFAGLPAYERRLLAKHWGPCTLLRLGRRATKETERTKGITMAVCPGCGGWTIAMSGQKVDSPCWVTCDCEGRQVRVDP